MPCTKRHVLVLQVPPQLARMAASIQDFGVCQEARACCCLLSRLGHSQLGVSVKAWFTAEAKENAGVAFLAS